jgi:Tol biopolymer transport system component
MNPDGTRKTNAAVSDGTFAAYKMPTWSPDGQRLAFRQVDAPVSANHATPSLAYIQQYGRPDQKPLATEANLSDRPTAARSCTPRRQAALNNPGAQPAAAGERLPR